jgi:hypothetical protein
LEKKEEKKKDACWKGIEGGKRNVGCPYRQPVSLNAVSPINTFTATQPGVFKSQFTQFKSGSLTSLLDKPNATTNTSIPAPTKQPTWTAVKNTNRRTAPCFAFILQTICVCRVSYRFRKCWKERSSHARPAAVFTTAAAYQQRPALVCVKLWEKTKCKKRLQVKAAPYID